jgi:hypothetical protein
MPRDERRLVFAHDEVVSAIWQFHRRTHKVFPLGKVENPAVNQTADGQCQFTCEIVNKDSRQPFAVGGDILGAALIHYCIAMRIPLPAKGEKRLEISDGELVLAVRFLVTKPQAPREEPARQVAGLR